VCVFFRDSFGGLGHGLGLGLGTLVLTTRLDIGLSPSLNLQPFSR